VLHDEALHVAQQLNRPDLEAQELVLRAQARTHAADTSGLHVLRVRLRTVVEERLTASDESFYRADLSWIDGEYELVTGRRGARATLESAIAQMAADTNSARQLRPRLSLARARAAEGDTVQALYALDSLLRSLALRAGAGASLFERARLTDGALVAGEVAATLLRPRATHGVLLRALSAMPFLDAEMPVRGGDVSRLDLAVRRLGDSVFVWSRAGRDWTLRATRLPAQQIHDAIAKLDTSQLAELYETLLAPELARVAGTVRTMRVDARDELAALPWAALYDRRSARHLVESVAVWYTTDMWRTPDAEAPMQPSRVLVIDAAPRDGRRALPGAQDEVQRISAIWGTQSTGLDGAHGAACALAAVPAFEVVHFAGHAVLDAERPERSYLELPALSDARISGLKLVTSAFPRVRLVVLAACDTRGAQRTARGAGGDARLSRGLASLADAFREAGVREVIGAAWAIDDAATAAMMEQLHAALRAGAAPTMALREAQLTGLRSQDLARRSPRVWAAFQLLGS
jgi:CHAT domain-containing protein